MNDEVNRLCDSVHEKLEGIEGRMESWKLNNGTSWHFLQEKLKELRRSGEATTQADMDARTCLEQWVKEKRAEAPCTIDQWVKDHDSQKLATRAQETEDCAGIAIEIAQASIDDAERMVLEAIAAWRDAEAVTESPADVLVEQT
jgi:hypothetical protein